MSVRRIASAALACVALAAVVAAPARAAVPTGTLDPAGIKAVLSQIAAASAAADTAGFTVVSTTYDPAQPDTLIVDRTRRAVLTVSVRDDASHLLQRTSKSVDVLGTGSYTPAGTDATTLAALQLAGKSSTAWVSSPTATAWAADATAWSPESWIGDTTSATGVAVDANTVGDVLDLGNGTFVLEVASGDFSKYEQITFGSDLVALSVNDDAAVGLKQWSYGPANATVTVPTGTNALSATDLAKARTTVTSQANIRALAARITDAAYARAPKQSTHTLVSWADLMAAANATAAPAGQCLTKTVGPSSVVISATSALSGRVMTATLTVTFFGVTEKDAF